MSEGPRYFDWAGSYPSDLMRASVRDLSYDCVRGAIAHSFVVRFRLQDSQMTDKLADEIMACMVTQTWEVFADLCASWNGDVRVVCGSWTNFALQFPTLSAILISRDSPHIVTDVDNEHILTCFNPQIVYEILTMPGGLWVDQWVEQPHGYRELINDDAVFALHVPDIEYDCNAYTQRTRRIREKLVPGGEVRMRRVSSPRLSCIEFTVSIHVMTVALYGDLDLREGDYHVVSYPTWLFYMFRAVAEARGIPEFFECPEIQILSNYVNLLDISCVALKRAVT